MKNKTKSKSKTRKKCNKKKIRRMSMDDVLINHLEVLSKRQYYHDRGFDRWNCPDPSLY